MELNEQSPRRTAARISPSTQVLENGPPQSAIGTLVGLEDAPEPQPTTEISAGGQLGGRYELLEEIGSGATGRIWRARHTKIGREFAIKLLTNRGESTNEDDLLREALALSKVTHPNVVSVSDFGFAQPGKPYAVMELLDGDALRTTLREAGPLSWTQARPLIEDLLEGLAAAHSAGVLHGDITPNNLFIERKHGRLKLIDFGLASGIYDRQREVLGTPAYMSPEQICQQPLDARSDLYSMACVVFEMLTGNPPFTGSSHSLLTQHLESSPPRASFGPDVPRHIKKLLRRCLAKHPDDRPQDASAVLEALRATPEPRRGRSWFGVAALLAVVAGLSWNAAQPPEASVFSTMSVHVPRPHLKLPKTPDLRAELPVVEIAKPIVVVESEPEPMVMAPPAQHPHPRRVRRRRSFANQVAASHGDSIPTFTPAPMSKPKPSFGPVDGLKNPFSADRNPQYPASTPTGP